MPEPINASATAWTLEASPSDLHDAADQLRTRATRLTSAQTTVDGAAAGVAGDWTGDTADVFQEHRAKVTGDLGDTATAISSVADTLSSTADLLTLTQALLDEQWQTISGVPHMRSGHDLRFQPRDDAEAAAVRTAISAAGSIRCSLDEELALKEAALYATRRDFLAIKHTWEPRQLTVINFNIGQGHGNVPAGTSLAERGVNIVNPFGDVHFGDAEDGTERAEMDEIADVIHGQGGDVVTLQEVFEEDLDQLEDELEKDGSEWTVHYTEASGKPHFDDSVVDALDPDDFGSHSFGNAVLVREGDVIEGSPDSGARGHKIDDEGSHVNVTPDYPHPEALPHPFDIPQAIADDGEGRSAAVAEVDLR
ncbi:MAG TPA: WXG100 family type VII secretion target [Candidatus Limnocylindrales bacterium]|nr:WXG100 family type VII secretion target [Candidatus Limnocylindrales bacterium]